MKFIRQLGINHIVVKAAKCFNKGVLIVRLNVLELFFEFAFGVHGTNFLEFFSKVLHGWYEVRSLLFNWCVLFVRCTTQTRSSFV